MHELEVTGGANGRPGVLWIAAAVVRAVLLRGHRRLG